MRSDALRSWRPEKSATAAMAVSTTTPAPVRGRVPAGWPDERRVAGAADCVPDALRGADAAVRGTVVLVVGVADTGGDALTFGVLSQGGHGAW